ncbi:BatD family protein [Aliiglaciecola sp. CAU 1673]|uniref:BatD family protein n=1 Tax=Aliiglaciecola sp. CAU 1673 TaxID=3032595 RepID=UPI0023DC20E1|nr:BatD family protein [Aliiglaciecola sp. CAU 1673]MDF2177103.1 BatD family protein [Aliiglaciecola sp. CAU 1673]
MRKSMNWFSLQAFCAFLILFFYTLSASAAVTEVRASVDKNPAMVDEAINLEITANDALDGNALDTSALLKDFVVGHTSVSSQTRIVNMDMTRTTTWTTQLIPRQPGRYEIPSFEIQGVRSEPIQLMVLPVSSATRAQARDVFVTTEVNTTSIYLQQQLQYKVRLHLAQDLQRGSLSTPSLDGADIRQVGKDVESTEIIDGRRMRIIERNFAIIPQASGQFSIQGPVFEGEVVDANSPSFGLFNRTKRLTRIGPAIDIEVKPVPANYQGHWLPSEMVTLHEEWLPANGEYRVGEPITRTVTLTALGVVDQLLPPIEASYPDTVKTYPDQANSATVDKDGRLIAQRTESIAIIPSKPGEITLPEVQLTWFNVNTGKNEVAKLAQKTLQILPALSDTQRPLPQLPQVQPDAPVANIPAASPTQTNGWWSLSSSFLLALWLLTLLGWWWTNRSKKIQHHEVKDNAHWAMLSQALSASDSSAVISHLGPFLANELGIMAALPELCEKLDDKELKQAIDELMIHRYGRESQAWTGVRLHNALKQWRKHNKITTVSGTELASLRLE